MKLRTVLIATISFLFIVTALVADVYVNSYTRSDGTYVSGHYRSSPNSTVTDNFSYYGNTNPYTGEVGTNRYANNPTSEYYSPSTSTKSTSKYYSPSTSTKSASKDSSFGNIIIIFTVIAGLYFFGLFQETNNQTSNAKLRNKSKKNITEFKVRKITSSDFESLANEKELIEFAINNKKIIEFLYPISNSDGLERRRIMPIKFVAYNNLCINGYCHKAQDERNFALNKISNLSMIKNDI